MEVELVEVVGVAVIRDGRVLAARRAGQRASGGWEFPGGRCEPGESLAAAAVREVLEELGCTVSVLELLEHVEPVDDRLVLHVALAELVGGEPVPREHDALRWLGPDQLDSVDWLPADVPFVALVRQRLLTSMCAMPLTSPTEHRLLLVHAHPDDETLNNGATMAKYAAEGRGVTLVTCTLGEEGEILEPGLEHLAADRDDALGEHRIGELAAAMKALGVTDHRFLGGPGRFRDSGMEWDETGHARAKSTVRDDTFWKADLAEAATLLVEIIREVRPQVLVTYDEFGNYGHPDHVQAHRVAMYGSQLAAVESYRPDLGARWDVAKIYWAAMSLSGVREEMRMLEERGIENPFAGMDLDNPPRFFVPDEAIACAVDGREYADAKVAAMTAHKTQIAVDGPFFALSNNIGNQVWGVEHYRLAKGTRGPVAERGWEDDLFAGL